jgi:hypothetical protein
MATSDKTKVDLLDDIFQDQDVIRDSDQVESFRDFWEFLMSPERQAEFGDLLAAVFNLVEIRNLDPDPFLARIKF